MSVARVRHFLVGLPAVGLLALLFGCGGADGPLTIASTNGSSLAEGADALRLSIVGGDGGQGATWRVSPVLGTITARAGGQADYTPPPVGSLPADTSVTVSADVGGSSGSIAIQLQARALVAVASAPGPGEQAGPTATPQVTFDRNVEGPAGAAVALTLRDPIRALAGSTQASGRTASFVPAAALAWGTRYVLTAADRFRSAVDALGASFALTFRTPDPSWTAKQPVVGSTFNAAPSAVPLGAGVIAVWSAEVSLDSGSRNLRYATYAPPAAGPGSAARIHALPGSSGPPQLAGDAVRSAMVVWQQSMPGGGNHVHAARFDAALGAWGAPVDLTPADEAGTPTVAADADGNYAVAWRQVDPVGGKGRIRVSRYTAATASWSDAGLPQPADVDAQLPVVASDALGNVVVAWLQASATGTLQPAAARKPAAAATWTMAPALQAGDDDASDLDLAMTAWDPRALPSAPGDAFLTWSRKPASGPRRVVAARYAGADDRWTAAAAGGTGNAQQGLPRVVVDAAGDATLVWQSFDAVQGVRIEAARYDAPAASWQPPTPLLQFASSTSEVGQRLALTVDAAGNVVAAWQISPAQTLTRYLYAARFSASESTWGAVESGFTASGRIGAPAVASDRGGNAMLLWVENVAPGVDSVMSSRLTGPG